MRKIENEKLLNQIELSHILFHFVYFVDSLFPFFKIKNEHLLHRVLQETKTKIVTI